MKQQEPYTTAKVAKQDIQAAAERLKNGRKWGPDDHVGTMNYTLDELSKACAGDNVNDFMFVGPALPITGAVGSPINPVAIR